MPCHPLTSLSYRPKTFLRTIKPSVPASIKQMAWSTSRTHPHTLILRKIFCDYDWGERHFSLMKAQHLFSVMVGYKKWGDMIQTSSAELSLAKLLWDNQHKIHISDWELYISQLENDTGTQFGTEDRLTIFKRVYAEADGHRSPFGDYRLN